MKKTLIFTFILFFSSILFSQTLESVCSSLAEHPNTTGDFVQTKTILTNGRKLKSNGKFILSTLGILWQTEKPFPSSLILTEDSMIQIAANGNKSVMSGKDNQIFANISDTLRSVFNGDAKKLQENFKCNFSYDKAGLWKVELTPKDSTIAAVMSTLILSGNYKGADGSDKISEATLNSLEMIEASGNTITYEFSNQKYPKELSADEKQTFVIE